MTGLTADRPRAGAIVVDGQTLETCWFGPGPEQAPTLVLLHEGLGSARMWGEFPLRLVAATGAGVLAYSRAGYGHSSPVALPRPFDYMHHEALVMLPRVLDASGVDRGLLVGCSDGASIATIFAGRIADPRIAGIVLMAPHFFVEDATVAGVAAARVDYETGDLRRKLARWHSHVDVAFRGWNDTWLDPAFKASWNITDALPSIRMPMLIIQGSRDDYATFAQIEAAQRGSGGPVEALFMPDVGHSPYRDAAAATVAAITRFAKPLIGGTVSGDGAEGE